ncbi:NADH dehydrogenase 1 alpha subcomplex subunit 12 ndufa12/DAP13 [Lobulomyces angularis]|nr:NADH dehydrogenase 1 alpha subcomplex subunit 12 ndufa12/DAP13 [Lobulomyces angularis]
MSTYSNLVVATLASIRTKGLKSTIYQILTADQPRTGTLVGTDSYGNQYYENPLDQSNRGRWVVYGKYNWDASQITPEWHGWIHRMTDDHPGIYKFSSPKFTPPHVEHLTGTSSRYTPYNTTTKVLNEIDFERN